MGKVVVNLKDYRSPLPEVIKPKGSLNQGVIIRQACCELYNTKSQPFYDAATSFDVSTSPVGAVWHDKATVVDQIIEHIKNTERDGGMEFPVQMVHDRFSDWARNNQISRKRLKEQARAIMIQAAQAAE